MEVELAIEIEFELEVELVIEIEFAVVFVFGFALVGRAIKTQFFLVFEFNITYLYYKKEKER